MGTKKLNTIIERYLPIIIGLTMSAVAILLFFIMKTRSGSVCSGNSGCIVLLPLFFIPALLLAYGISTIIAFFLKDVCKKFKDKGVYNLAFRITIILWLAVFGFIVLSSL